MRVKPFQPLRPPPSLASRVASLPYDVVTTDEARQLADGNPMSFLHVVRSEIDLPADVPLYDDRVYAKARENFHRFQHDGCLLRAPREAVYLYRQAVGTHQQAGFVVCCHVEDFERHVIRKHEKTRKAAEDDRTRHVATLNANTGPVFLTYRDDPSLDLLAKAAGEAAPLYDFDAVDGVRHTVWEIGDARPVVEAFRKVPCAYVADGHHRSASAARVARDRRAASPQHRGDEEYNWFLAVLFPCSQLRILPYNRTVKDLNGRSTSEFLDAVRATFQVRANAGPAPDRPGRISMYCGGRWYGLSWERPAHPDPVEDLDVSVLQNCLLAPLLGIEDPRNNPRLEFVGGVRGTAELEQRVAAGRAAVAFSLYPTIVEQLMTVADAGRIMPPKSTWFEPKLRSGLLVHTLD